ncbi:hypothetical protein FGO68_gene6705 [Halteria grandinella]|uniref:Transmembrane protein n=1 Tax=Halteria grandinella TaxID=5974 RepID=A0A8J8SY74_HALGN|nr:hypothetical protein FGO68_gene6705 [Halteria grandinella]
MHEPSEQGRQFGRVVKASDSKSLGVSRAGSNPAVVVLFTFHTLPALLRAIYFFNCKVARSQLSAFFFLNFLVLYVC